MTLEEALKRIEFLEKALDGAIDFAGIQRVDYGGVGFLTHYRNIEERAFQDEPELVEYIKQR